MKRDEYVYLITTADRLELPVAQCDTLRDVAKWTGKCYREVCFAVRESRDLVVTLCGQRSKYRIKKVYLAEQEYE